MNPSVITLEACLHKETQLMSDFLRVLQDESKVLEDGASETELASTTTSKNNAAEALAEAAHERNSLLEAMGFEADGPGLEDAALAHPSLADARKALLDITAQARSLNEANGRIIDVFLNHNQQTLDTLRRLTGVGDIYDATGRRAGNKGSSRNIKA